MLYFEGPHNLLRPRFSFFANGTYNGITVASKSAGPAGPPSLKFEGPHVILWAIGPIARLILILAISNKHISILFTFL